MIFRRKGGTTGAKNETTLDASPAMGQTPPKPTSTSNDIPNPKTSHQVDKHSAVESSRITWRETIAAHSFSPRSLLDYARFLIQQSSGSAAEEILSLPLAQDGTLVDALELYLELVIELQLPESRISWALNRLCADIEQQPAAHRGALDYAIQFDLTAALSIIGAGDDPVNRTITRINRAYGHDKEEASALADAAAILGENDINRARPK